MFNVVLMDMPYVVKILIYEYRLTVPDLSCLHQSTYLPVICDVANSNNVTLDSVLCHSLSPWRQAEGDRGGPLALIEDIWTCSDEVHNIGNRPGSRLVISGRLDTATTNVHSWRMQHEHFCSKQERPLGQRKTPPPTNFLL